ncbi:MAG: beta-xylosidase [Bacteroides sp.]|nr:beta-xylosidase [Bacteroides sp.]
MKKLFCSLLLLCACCAMQAQETTNYLMSYFKDATHSVYFAISRDGKTFADVNGYKPVLYGTKYAEQRGVRDPHIYRAPDSCYYVVLTDLNVAAQQMGFRDTRWQRDGKKYGWGNNRAIVMMKSRDLINWTSSVFRLDEAFAETREVGRFWAPQTIWDKEAGRLMVYFTLGMAGQPNALYYSYADPAFTRLTEVPRPFDVRWKEGIDLPSPAGQGIDQDITEADGRFRMFYCWKGRIIQAVADRLTGTYVADTIKVDGEPAGSEAPNVWRIEGTGKYWLMYHPYARKGETDTNFGFSATTDFRHFDYKGRMNEDDCPIRSLNFDMPNHGTVIQLPAEDARKLARYWRLDYDALPSEAGR